MFQRHDLGNGVPSPIKPFDDDRRGTRRRQRLKTWWGEERRSGKERRQDADWRFAYMRSRFADEVF